MNQDLPQPPEPNPPRLSLESLQQQLRALPPPVVPEGLPKKLLAALPATAASTSVATAGASKVWLWLLGLGVALAAVSTLIFVRLASENSNAHPAPSANQTVDQPTPDGQPAPVTSKAIRDGQQAVQIDPYNANAWFNLAKAQAAEHLADDAISSAQKALDIAHSRNQAGLAEAVEAWLHSQRAAQSKRP